jgi:hypothetical protein
MVFSSHGEIDRADRPSPNLAKISFKLSHAEPFTGQSFQHLSSPDNPE